MRCALDSLTCRPVPAALKACCLGACLLLLAGCAGLATTPPAPQIDALPTAWSGAPSAPLAPAQRQALLAWWQQFDDPQLSALVTQALDANTTVRSAQAAVWVPATRTLATPLTVSWTARAAGELSTGVAGCSVTGVGGCSVATTGVGTVGV